jgi:hypothetical protein
MAPKMGLEGRSQFIPLRQSVGLNRQVCVGGKVIRGLQRPPTGLSTWLVSDQAVELTFATAFIYCDLINQ